MLEGTIPLAGRLGYAVRSKGRQMDGSTLTTSKRAAPATATRVTLRMFAAARQAAGTGKLALEAVTVADALSQAADIFGPGWAEVAASSRTWVNGDPAGPDQQLQDGDEVAVLPPVSGGVS